MGVFLFSLLSFFLFSLLSRLDLGPFPACCLPKVASKRLFSESLLPGQRASHRNPAGQNFAELKSRCVQLQIGPV